MQRIETVPRRKITQAKPENPKFYREDKVLLPDGFEVVRGEIFRVRKEHGTRFKFHSLVTNTETGSQWVDCFEMFRGATGSMRAFRIEEIKRIPVRSKRARRIKTD